MIEMAVNYVLAFRRYHSRVLVSVARTNVFYTQQCSSDS